MDSLLSALNTDVTQPYLQSSLKKDPSDITDQIILEESFKGQSDSAAKVSFSIPDLPRALTVTTQEIIDRLNELLVDDLPEGISSLQPEKQTPEATADRIVQGATAFFDVYASQNPELEGEALLNGFLETIKGGIESGYDEAFNILEGIGAFEVEGVQDGVEETKKLIAEKLAAYEAQKREELGLDPIDVSTQVASDAKEEFLLQAGATVKNNSS